MSSWRNVNGFGMDGGNSWPQDGHTLTDMAQIELVLSSLRTANIAVADMQLHEADLEDVFLSLVGKQ